MQPVPRKHLPWLCLVVGLMTGELRAAPIDATLTYQGRLLGSGSAAQGLFDFRFSLYDAPTNGARIGRTDFQGGVLVDRGMFSVPLSFSAAAFDGNARWLEIALRTGTNDFAILQPRQPITAAPYAVTALKVLGLAAATNTLATALSAQISAATNSLWVTDTNWVLAQGFQRTNALTRRALTISIPSNGTNHVVDFAREVVQLTATNDVNLLQSTNRVSAGSYGECVWYIQGGPANRALTVNSNWIGLGTLASSMPFLLASNRLAIVAISVRGDDETNVTYAISRQQ